MKARKTQLSFKNIEEPNKDSWFDEQKKKQEKHILDGKLNSNGTWEKPVIDKFDEKDWAYIDISELLRFYKQYTWPTTPFHCNTVPDIDNLSEFVRHHIGFMHIHKGTIEYLPSLRIMKALKKELSKKKNLPKTKIRWQNT